MVFIKRTELNACLLYTSFEELYDFSNPDEPVKVAEHKDIEDDGQTVLITERIIKIHTSAMDKDGNKAVSYTHLDVYKRQIHFFQEIFCRI